MGYIRPTDEAPAGNKVRQMRRALENAKLKLQLYREAHEGEYLGGVEYTQLMREIDEALAPVPRRAAGCFS